MLDLFLIFLFKFFVIVLLLKGGLILFRVFVVFVLFCGSWEFDELGIVIGGEEGGE